MKVSDPVPVFLHGSGFSFFFGGGAVVCAKFPIHYSYVLRYRSKVFHPGSKTNIQSAGYPADIRRISIGRIMDFGSC